MDKNKKSLLAAGAVILGGVAYATTKCIKTPIYTDHPFKTDIVYAKEGVYVERESYEDYKKTNNIDYGIIVNRRVRKPVAKEEVIKKAKLLLGIENANNFTTNVDEVELLNTNNSKNKMTVYNMTWENTNAENKELAYIRLIITDDLQVVEFSKQYAHDEFNNTQGQINSLTEEEKTEIKKQLASINPEEVNYLNFDKINITGTLPAGVDIRIPVEEKGIEVIDQNLNKKEVVVIYNKESKEITTYKTAGFINQAIQTPKINKENIETHFKTLLKINPTVEYREYRQDELVKEYMATNKIDLNTKFRTYYTYKLPEDRISMLSLDHNALVQVNSEQTMDLAKGVNQMLMATEETKSDGAAESFINKSTKDIKLTDFEKEALEDSSIPDAEKKELREKFKKHLLNPKHEHSEEIKIEKRINKNNEPETIYIIRQQATDYIRLDYEVNGKEPNIKAIDMSGKNRKLDPKKQYLLNSVEIVYNKTLDQIEEINKENNLYNSNIAEDITVEDYLKQAEVYKSSENNQASFNYKEVKSNKERKEIIKNFIKNRKDLPEEYEIERQKLNELYYSSKQYNDDNEKFNGWGNNVGIYQVKFKKSGKEIKDYTYNFTISANGEIYNFSKSGDFGEKTLTKAGYEEIEKDLNKPMLEYINKLMEESKQYIKQNNDGTIENIYGNIEEATSEIDINREGNSNRVKKVELKDIEKSKHQEELRNILANNYIPESLDGKSIKDKITFNELKEIIGWDINPYYDSRGINDQEILYDKAYKEAVYEKIKNTENYKNLIENLRKQIENLDKDYKEISNQPEVNVENYFEIKYPKDKYREFYNSKNFAEHLKGGEHRGLYLLDLGKSDWVMKTDWTLEDVLLNVYK